MSFILLCVIQYYVRTENYLNQHFPA